MTRPSSARLEIGQLRLHLPASYADRGAHVARLIGEQLAAKPWTRDISRDQLELRGLQLPAGLSDHQIATTIADAIHDQLTKERGRAHG